MEDQQKFFIGAGGSFEEADSLSRAITSALSSMLQSMAAPATSATDSPSDVSTPCSLQPFSAASSSLSVSHMDASKTMSPSVFSAVPKTASSESLAGNLPHAEKMQVVSAGESESGNPDDVIVRAQKENIPLHLQWIYDSDTTSSSVFSGVPKTASSESLAGNLPDPEKMQVVISGESESSYSDDVTAQKEKIQFLQSGAPVPKDAMNEQKEKSEEISNLEPNLPLPLILISRVLKDIPHCPHFFPLRKFSELLREKLMAALDQTFEDTVDLIHGLTNANDFLERASDLWMAAGELETMGYNVFLIRRRLVEMKDVVIDLVERKLTIFELKTMADYHRVEKNRLLNLILSLKNKVAVEELNKEQLLNKVNILEEELSNSDDLMASFAMKPFGMNN